ncbi:hypothetical protein CBM2637_B100087 [Cupriavidus taiwanensis]|nr:hypothetical protein CBM2637_B100087 [Cupriavidus taiwanensis]
MRNASASTRAEVSKLFPTPIGTTIRTTCPCAMAALAANRQKHVARKMNLRNIDVSFSQTEYYTVQLTKFKEGFPPSCFKLFSHHKARNCPHQPARLSMQLGHSYLY